MCCSVTGATNASLKWRSTRFCARVSSSSSARSRTWRTPGRRSGISTIRSSHTASIRCLTHCARAHRAVGRALDLDAVHHHAWHVRAVTCYFDRDRDGFEHAAERALALNPHNTNTTAFLAFLFSQLGETDRACDMTERAMALNPAYPGWYHFVFFDRHYMRGEFAEALAQARKINMAQNLWSPWAVAVAAGQLARAADAKAALDALFALAPAFEQEGVLREAITRWRWNQPANVDLAMDGFRKAKALAGSGIVAAVPEARPLPARSADSAAGLAADAFVVTVIPFTSPATGDAAELADGLTQGTAVGLSRFSYLRVVTRHVAPESLTTGYVLQGSVRMAGGVVRVVTQLTEAKSGQSLWAETYDRKAGAGSLFELQDELIEKIVATIADVNGALVRAMAAVVRQKPADALTPYEAVLRALAYISLMSPEEHATLRQALEGAVERAPNYADAWAALAFIYSEEHAQGFNVRPQVLERARRGHAARAGTGFSEPARLLHALPDVVLHARPVGAPSRGRSADRAQSAGDARAGVYRGRHGVLGRLGRRPGVLRERAMALNPNHAGIYHMPSVIDRYRRRDYPGALAILDRVNMPGYPNAMLVRAAVYAQLGRLDDALAVWRDVEARVPGYARPRAGRPDEMVPARDRRAHRGRYREDPPARRSPDPAGIFGRSRDRTVDRGPAVRRPQPRQGSGLVLRRHVRGDPERALAVAGPARRGARVGVLVQESRRRSAARSPSKLGVATVLQGSVRRAGDRVRVTVQLVDASNGFQLWSDRYDRELKDIFDVQDEIARTIAERLKVSLSLGAGDRLVATGDDQSRGLRAAAQGPHVPDPPRARDSRCACPASSGPSRSIRSSPKRTRCSAIRIDCSGCMAWRRRPR